MMRIRSTGLALSVPLLLLSAFLSSVITYYCPTLARALGQLRMCDNGVWVLSLSLKPNIMWGQKVFRIHNQEIRGK